MSCPLCRDRPARRFCPAKGARICPVCCGTKRQVEISCPTDCVFLASARTHPPATVKRQHQKDAVWMSLMLEGLDQRQQQVCWLVLQPVLAFRDPFLAPVDADLADAAGTLAATYETSGKGVIYEHRAGSLAAQRLSAEVRRVLDEAGVGSSRALERDAVVVLRRIEGAARAAGRQPGAGRTVLLEALARVAVEAARDARAEARQGPVVVLP